MVAQTKVDVRSAAAKTAAAGKPGPQDEIIVDSKELLGDQVAAAAVVDAEQSDAVAVQDGAAVQVAAEGGILPTEAPIQSIGEIAQAPAPTTTDTATPATTPAPEAAAAETTALSPWAIGGIALVGVGAVAAAASSGDDDKPAPPPGNGGGDDNPPPVNSLPTSVDSTVTISGESTALSATDNFKFVDTDEGDSLASVTIASITPAAHTDAMGDAVRFGADGKAYELVTDAVTWEAAKAAAEAKGGYLAVLDSEEEMALINSLYDGLGGPEGDDGTWVGASQAAGALTPGEGWTWVNDTPLAGDASIWNVYQPGDVQLPFDNDGNEADHSAQYAAIFDGDTPDTDFKLLYDHGTSVTTLPQYLIEYDNAAPQLTLNGSAVTAGQTIAAAELGNLSWDSMFNEGGTITYNVTDSQGGTSVAANTVTINPAAPVTYDGGASQAVSALIEDQHLTGLA